MSIVNQFQKSINNPLNSTLSLKQKQNQYRKSFLFQTKHLKQKSKQSFQRSFQLKNAESIKNSKENQTNTSNNNAKEDYFMPYIKKQYQKMLQQKDQNPTLMIPSGFQKFITSKLFIQFVQKIYEYMAMLIEYENKFKNLNQIMLQSHNSFYKSKSFGKNQQPQIKTMRYQTNQLQQKCKQISYVYMGILLSHGESKFIFKDQYFFQTMIYFIAMILKGIFDQEEYVMIEEQLNRIFRTNAFNLIKRRHEEDKLYKKFPVLKQTKYESSVFGVSRTIRRLNIQKRFNYSMHIDSKLNRQTHISKPIEIQLSTFGSVKSRSPLISSFYPSSKQKLYQFGKSARQKQTFIKQSKRPSKSFCFPRQ